MLDDDKCSEYVTAYYKNLDISKRAQLAQQASGSPDNAGRILNELEEVQKNKQAEIDALPDPHKSLSRATRMFLGSIAPVINVMKVSISPKELANVGASITPINRNDGQNPSSKIRPLKALAEGYNIQHKDFVNVRNYNGIKRLNVNAILSLTFAPTSPKGIGNTSISLMSSLCFLVEYCDCKDQVDTFAGLWMSLANYDELDGRREEDLLNLIRDIIDRVQTKITSPPTDGYKEIREKTLVKIIFLEKALSLAIDDKVDFFSSQSSNLFKIEGVDSSTADEGEDSSPKGILARAFTGERKQGNELIYQTILEDHAVNGYSNFLAGVITGDKKYLEMLEKMKYTGDSSQLDQLKIKFNSYWQKRSEGKSLSGRFIKTPGRHKQEVWEKIKGLYELHEDICDLKSKHVKPGQAIDALRDEIQVVIDIIQTSDPDKKSLITRKTLKRMIDAAGNKALELKGTIQAAQAERAAQAEQAIQNRSSKKPSLLWRIFQWLGQLIFGLSATVHSFPPNKVGSVKSREITSNKKSTPPDESSDARLDNTAPSCKNDDEKMRKKI